MSIRENYRRLEERVEEYCSLAGRGPRCVFILPVTKGIDVERMREAYELGFRVFGENRVQEAYRKAPIFPDVRWHLIGHLQTNKVKKAINLFSLIQSVDSLKLVEHLDRRLDRPFPVFLEFNTSGEPRKHGFSPEDMERAVEGVLGSRWLRLEGFMTVGPYPVEEGRSRRAFALLRELKERAEEIFGIRIEHLSMGMSEDYHWAILEGSTMIRPGRALFGERRN